MIVCTYYTPDYAPIAALTEPRLREYCRKHEYVLDCSMSESSDPMWHRFDIMERHKQLVRQSIVWIDSDCYIMDMDFDLLTLANTPEDYVTAEDFYGLCDCITRIRDNEWTWKFIDAMRLLGNVKGSTKFLQDTAKLVSETFPAVGKHVRHVPGLLSDPDRMIPGSFVYHAWGTGHGPTQAVNRIAKVAAKLQET